MGPMRTERGPVTRPLAFLWISCLVLAGCRATLSSTGDFALDKPGITPESFEEDLANSIWAVLCGGGEASYVLTPWGREVYPHRESVAREMFARGYTEIPVERAAEWQIYRVNQPIAPPRFDIRPSSESEPAK